MVLESHDTWSLVLLDLNDYGAEMNGSYRIFFVKIDIFIIFVGTLLHKNKNPQR